MSAVKGLVIIDSGVQDAKQIINKLPSGTEWVILDQKSSGLQQIVEILSSYQNLDNIQIISHGDTAELYLGSDTISNENLEYHQESFTKIGQSLSSSGDLLFYGCNVAAGSEGEKFVNKISQYSGAGVSASSNFTGFAALGGDFVLEYTSGEVETHPITLYGLNSVLWSSGLTDANVKAKVQTAESNGASFTFLEMRDILDTAKVGGINTNEWNDLNTIFDQVNAANNFENDFVKYASYSVIKGNTKFNSKFFGGVTKAADIKTVGNMSAGFSETNANYLIQEWFYGGDTPMPLAGGDSANPDSASGVYENKTFTSNASLYEADKRPDNETNGSAGANSTITADDVNQGAVGSCYYVAAIGAMAHIGNGSLISNCFIETGDSNVWGIRYIMPGGEEVYVTVNKDIAGRNTWWAGDQHVFSGNIDKSLDGEMWVALLEKSWAQFNQYLGRADGINSYGAIEGGWADPIKYLTGLEFTYYSAHADWYKYYGFNKIDTGNTGKQIIIDALANDGIGWIASWTPTYTDSSGNYSTSGGAKNLIAQHAHMVLEYDANKGSGEFLVRNPWGGDASTNYQPEWWMTWEEMIGANLQTILAVSESATNLLSDPTPPTPKTFNYTISSDSSNPNSSAKAEGEDITFSITRDDTGEESVVYVSTLTGTANHLDYAVTTKQEIKFLSHEQLKTITIGTYNDVANSEGYDSFSLGLYKSLTQADPTVQETAYIKDSVPPDYSYTIVSNTSASSDTNFRSEGGKVKFTITRTLDSGTTNAETTVYLNTALKSTTASGPNSQTITGASADDFVALNNHAVTFKAIETTKKVYIDVVSDSAQEGYEFFDVNLYEDAANATTPVTATGYIKDEWAPNYNYSITSNAGDENSAIDEGQNVTFTITRSGSGTESTVYLSTIDKTAMNGDDYNGFQGQSLTFSKNQKVLNVEVETRLDTWVEPVQFFDLGLYTNVNDQTVLATGTGFIKDTYVDPDYYTITNSSLSTGDPDAIATTQTLDSTGAQNLSLEGAAATLGGKIVSITSVGDDTGITFTITGKDTEDDEAVSEESASTVSGALTLVGSANTVSFENAHKITLESAGDDSSVTFTIVGTDANGGAQTEQLTGADTGIATTTNLFKSISSVTASASTAGTVKAGIAANTITEVLAGTDKGVATSTKIFSSVTQIQASGDTAGSVTAGYIDGTNEGSDITFTITRTNTNDMAASIFVDTSDATAKDTDYDPKEKFEISFKKHETQKTFTVSTKSDSVTDANEYLWANFYMNETTETSFVNSKAYLKDVAVPTAHTYTITHDSPTGSAKTEGENITFTITRATTGGAEASTIYLSTLNNTTDDEDLVGLDKLQIDFANKEEIKTVTVTTKSDAIGDESEEDFFLLLYETLGDAQTGDNYQHSQAYIANAAAADYNYTVTAEDYNWSNPVEESGVITFTVTRSLQTGSAAPSTVYVSTTAGNADTEDYIAIDKVPLSFATQETSKTVKVTTVSDSETEGKEYFWLDVFKTYDDAASGNWYAYDTGYITDPSGGTSSEYSYSITSSHGSSGAGVTEGGEVTFTITRTKDSGTDAATTVYLTTSDGTAGAGDYNSLNLFEVEFKSTETTKEVTVQTLADSETDDDEYFWVDLYKSAADQDSGNYAAYGQGYIADDTSSSNAASTYQYAVTSSHGSDSAAQQEGKDIVFTITRSRVDSQAITSSDAKTTVYVSTADGSAYSEDYTSIDKLALEFKNDETVKTVTVSTILDSNDEGTTSSDAEYFWLDLFKTLADVDSYNYHDYGTGYIVDDSNAADALANYTYSVASSHGTSGNGVNEGGEITFTITRAREDGNDITNSDIATTVYVSTSEGTAYADDYVGVQALAVDFKKSETTKEVTIKTNIDQITDDDEYFWLDLYKTKADIENYNYEAWAEGYIANDSNATDAAANYSYTVTSSHNTSGAGVKEGNDITFTITRTKTGSGNDLATTIYYSTTAGTASDEDFQVITNQVLEFKADETSKIVTVSTKADDESDDDEYFWFDIYKTLTDAQNYDYYQWDQGYIANDSAAATAASTYKYVISSVNDTGNSGTATTEGGLVTFTITRSRVDNQAIDEANDIVSQVYVSTETGTADHDDFIGISQQLVEFKKGQTTAEVQVQTLGDALSESEEYLTLELYKTLSDYDYGDFHSYGNAHIANDNSQANAINNFDYSITSSHDYGSAASEGTDIIFTITRTKNNSSASDQATTVYVTTTHSTTDDGDITNLNAQAVDFKADETQKTITVSTSVDSETEGEEYFWLDLFKSKADAEDYNYHAWAAGYLTDNSDAATAVNQYSYTVTSSASTSISAAEEGNDIVFTITRTNDTGGTDVASTVYVSTSDSLAYGGEDYKSLDLTQVDFKASETSKEITVKTYADNDTEGEEDFWLDLYKTKADAEDFNYHSYSTGYLKDAAGGGGSSATYSYAISITSGASTAEGGNITASVSRTVDSGSAGDSTIYFNTTAGSADETDYVAQKATAINFDSGNAAQTITIATLSDGDAGEGNETFWIDLFNTEADAEEGWDYFDYATATIADAAAIASAGITYSITNNSGYSSQQGEDQTVTFTISDGGSTDASTVYVSTVSGTATTGVDFKSKNKLQVDFASDVNTVDVVVDLIHDTIDDDDEFFYLELYKTAQDADAGLSSTDSLAYINQVAPALDDWTYSVSNVGSYSNPISEGEDFVFTISRSGGTATNTTVYVSTTASSADESDYTAITGQAVTFTGSDDLSKTVTVSTTTDSATEGTEYFWLDLFRSEADLAINNYDAWGTGHLQDPPAEGENSGVYFTVERSSSWNTTEGDDINFVVTKHGTATSTTTAYVATGFGTATQDSDYTNIPTTALEFGANETTKTVTVSTITDENDEPGSGYGETLYLLLINSSDGAYYNYITDTDGDGLNDSNGYAQAWILDPVSSNSAANAGNSSTPTVTITSAPKSSFPGHKAGTFFNDYAFAAKTSSGSVVAWGNAAKGGDTSPVANALSGVSNIYSNNDAFAAVLSDGSVVTWGDPESGGTNWDLDGLSESSTMTAGGNLTLGGALTTGGSATFSQPQKIVITSAGDDTLRTFTVSGKDAAGSDISEQITGANAGTARGSTLFKIVESISVDSATAGSVSAGSIASQTFAIASSLDGTVDVSKIASTPNAFAALKTDGSVVAWGSPGTGGDTSGLIDEDLDGSVSAVREIFSNNNSFAALRADGSVITWGISAFGGNSSSVENKIKTTTHADFQQVTSIVATGSAYAAIRADGSVVTWGNSLEGGDSSSIATEIDGDTDVHDVVQVYATTSAFAALRKDGSVITWGDANNGGTSTDVASNINGGTDVKAIYSTNNAFAALRSDGSVITWGDGNSGGNSTAVASDLDGTVNVSKIFATNNAFAAIREDGKVVTWGYNSYGGDSSGVSALINGTLDGDCISASQTLSNLNFTLNGDLISSSAATFTNAQRVSITSSGDDSGRTFTVTGTDKDGASLTATITGANAGTASSTEFFKTVTAISVDAAPSSSVSAGVVDKTVTTIVATDKAFSALRADGSIITWGDTSGGGDSTSVSNNLILSADNTVKVSQLYSSSAAFSAIKDDGSVVTWGDNDRGGSSTSVDFGSVTVQGMSGASSGVNCTAKIFNQNSSGNDVAIANKAIAFSTSAGADAGTITSDGSGALDVSSLDDGNYSAKFVISKTADYSMTQQVLQMTDVLDIYDFFAGVRTPTGDQIVASNVTWATGGDTTIGMDDVLTAYDMFIGKTDGYVILRDSTASAPTYNSGNNQITNASSAFDIQAGTDLSLNAYFLGDTDGGYANNFV